MRILLIALSMSLLAAEAHAISSYNPTQMNCADAQGGHQAGGRGHAALDVAQSRRAAIWPLCQGYVLLRHRRAGAGNARPHPRQEILRGQRLPAVLPQRFLLIGLDCSEPESVLGGRRRAEPHTFQSEHLQLGGGAARGRETTDLASGRQHPVTGDDERHRIGAERGAGFPREAGVAGKPREFAVASWSLRTSVAAPRHRSPAGTDRRPPDRQARPKSRPRHLPYRPLSSRPVPPRTAARRPLRQRLR